MEGPASLTLRKKSVFISAGEQSGEMHGSALVSELQKQCSDASLEVSGLGGEMMKSRGVNLLYDINSLAAVGLLEVAKKYSYFKKVLDDCVRFIKENKPDAVILIDYPGFNLKLAEKLRSFYKGKIIYYISPQIWAWNEKRAYKIKKYIDKMLVVFPFEVEFYEKFGVDAQYVGHPLVKRIRKFLDDNKKNNKAGSKKMVTVLPGSRNNEIKHYLLVLLKTVKDLSKEFELEVKISKAISIDQNVFDLYSAELNDFKLTGENVYDLMLNSDLVMCKAGTSTLECALIGTPHFVFLKTAPINYFLMKPLVNINNIGIVNIIAKKNIVKEFIQKDFKAKNLLIESRKLLTDAAYRAEQSKQLKKVWEILGSEDASYNAAKIIKNIALN
jgi:lipid-A-disaccharide synthase